MDTARTRMTDLVASLDTIQHATLHDISAGQVTKIVRRIVDHNAVTPKLDVAAFNSAI